MKIRNLDFVSTYSKLFLKVVQNQFESKKVFTSCDRTLIEKWSIIFYKFKKKEG
ncbi:uncharacterized protein METZ01_LOCUS341562 [marine metagenome]|uniref:Uncharacterized protein n=1 Tax=marine metagenome TaxID=408172 RepID=A0A382QUY5_9ZZZZ